MAKQQSKNDVAWQTLFARHRILETVDAEGICPISAADINKEREARLMTKFDHLINLPDIFDKSGLTILPNSRSSYVIGRFKCYEKLHLEKDPKIIEMSLPEGLESISPDNLYSEPSALLCAQHAGLIADALELEEGVALTVFGRMTTGQFDFSILDNGSKSLKNIEVKNSQCEIDGGFEGANAFALIEAKNQTVTDFHVRQLYYPYRLWTNKMSKQVIPVFFTYSNEVFSFYVYQFADITNYNSLELLRAKHYRIVPTEIEISDVRRILAQTKVGPEPTKGADGYPIPFPQADTFETVIDLLTKIQAAKGALSQEDTTINYAFDVRQSQYYSNACRYLGLVERHTKRNEGVTYVLNEAGRKLMQKQPRARNLALVELILSHQVFREAMVLYLTQGVLPSKIQIEALIAKAGININETTADRRASTVSGWVRWIARLTKDA